MVVKKSEIKKIIKEKIVQKVHESPDIVYFNDGDVRIYKSRDAITFGYFDNILYTSEDIGSRLPITHADLGDWILDQVYDEDSPKPKGFENLSIERGDFKFAGRLWTEPKIISFWEYPKTDAELDKVISDLNGKLKDIKINDSWRLDLGFENNNEFSRNSKLEPISSYKSSREATPADAGKAHIAFGKQGNVPSGVGSKFKFKNRMPGETVAQMRARTSINENKTKMKKSELQQIIREEISKVLNENITKTILGVQFNVVLVQAGMKFEFKDAKQFRKSGVSVNALVSEITKMLDDKFGKGTFKFVLTKSPSGFQDDPAVNGLEFKMNASNFFKDL